MGGAVFFFSPWKIFFLPWNFLDFRPWKFEPSRENILKTARENLKVPREIFRQISPVKTENGGREKNENFHPWKAQKCPWKKNLKFPWNLRRKHTYYEICDDHLSKLKHRWFFIVIRTLELKINHLFLIKLLSTINLSRVGTDFFNHDCKITDFSFTKITS